MIRGPNSTRPIHRGNRESIRFPQSLREANCFRAQAPLGCPLPRVAAARPSWAMEEFPFRERTRPGPVRAGAGHVSTWDEADISDPGEPLNNRNPFGVRAAIDRLRFGTFAVSGRSSTAIIDQVIPSRVLRGFQGGSETNGPAPGAFGNRSPLWRCRCDWGQHRNKVV